MAESDSTKLDVLFPEVPFLIGGRTVTIKPFEFGDIPKVSKLMTKTVTTMLAMFPKENVDLNLLDPVTVILIMEMIGDLGDDFYELLAIGSKQPVGDIKKLEIDQGVILAFAVYQVNQDFFKNRLWPLIQTKLPESARSLIQNMQMESTTSQSLQDSLISAIGGQKT